MMCLARVSFLTLILVWASAAAACAVDAVSGKTDTTINISWDLSGCSQVNSGSKFHICWKHSGSWTGVCGSGHEATDNNTAGTYVISGLSPSTSYKIKTEWHKNSSWKTVTTRTVTTNPTPTSSGLLLRYEKGSGQPYCVTFYWKNPPSLATGSKLALNVQHTLLGIWVTAQYQDHLANPDYNGTSSEYSKKVCGFSNNFKYRTFIYERRVDDTSSGALSNTVKWN